MRKLGALIALVGMASPAFAAKRVTVAQLEQTLAAVHGGPDADAARQLSDLELTERLSTAQLSSLETGLPGEKARTALRMLADASAFLDPPAAEILALPAPDLATQRQILDLTVNYVTETVHKLPNFFATRITTSFEGAPEVQSSGAISTVGMASFTAHQPLHPVGISRVTVLYRDGHEVVDAGPEKTRKAQPAAQRLTTAGVFGPVLVTVLVDAAQSKKLAWSHWEQGATGPEAVFSYAVPREMSHYTVNWESLPADQSKGCITRTQSFSKLVPYHGEIAVDPVSGTILRLVLAADMKPDDFTVKSGIAVEYGRVEIGGRSYFGPVKSVSSTLAHSPLQMDPQGCLWNEALPGLKTSLNDVVFEDYHMFRAETRVLAGNEGDQQENDPPVRKP
jgi:hypothetical protein